jgi:hypothetical protein
VPIGEQAVRVHLDGGTKVRSVKLLVAGTAPMFRQTGAWLELTVPSVNAHEVLAIDC